MKFSKIICGVLSATLLASIMPVSKVDCEVLGKEEQYLISSDNFKNIKQELSQNDIDEIINNSKDMSDFVVATLTEKEAEILSENEDIDLVENNIQLFGHSKQGPKKPAKKHNTAWNIQMINADVEATSKTPIKVGVIDTGINSSTEYNVAANIDYTDESTFLFQDLSGHGTSVAGVIASSELYGINNNVELYSIKALNSDNTASLSDVISGIYWAIENDLDILNMSFGTSTYSEALENAINDAYNAGILIVASAGNDDSIKYPAAFSNVIAVGSIDNNGEIVSENASLYNNILFAPGENIVSAGDFGTTTVNSGTSMAAPHVTAVASMLWQKDNTKSNAFIKDLLFATANTSVDGAKIADAKCALDGFDAFASNYTENHKQVIPNTSSIQTFTDDTVEALWGGKDHKSTVDVSGANLSTFLKNMSVVPDDKTHTIGNSRKSSNYLGLKENSTIKLSDGSYFNMNDTFSLRTYSILHGRGNYVSSLRFLYSVAQNLVSGKYTGSTRIKTIQNAINATISASDKQNNSFYNDAFTYGNVKLTWANSGSVQKISSVNYNKKFTAKEQRLMLEKAIYIVCNYHFDGQNNAYDDMLASGKYSNVTKNNAFEVKAALKIIGIATHLCGDIYAHKTVVPIGKSTTFTATVTPNTRNKSTIYRGTADDFNGKGRWSAANGIKTLVEGKSCITTQNILQWQMGDKDSNKTEYPDSTDFYAARLNKGAKKLISNMYNSFFTTTASNKKLGRGNFDFTWFLHDDYNLRLANLQFYAYRTKVNPTNKTLLAKLIALDSAVCLSDVVATNNTYTPSQSGGKWGFGYLQSNFS